MIIGVTEIIIKKKNHVDPKSTFSVLSARTTTSKSINSI